MAAKGCIARRNLALCRYDEMSASPRHSSLWEHPLTLADDLILPATRMKVMYLLLVLGFLPVLLLLATDRFAMLARLSAWTGLVLAGLPTLAILTNRRARPSSLAGLSLMITLCYFLATLHEERLLLRWGEARITESSVSLAMIYAALSIPVLQLGAGLCGSLGIPKLLPRLSLPLSDRALLGGGLLIVGWSLLFDVLRLRGVVPRQQQLISVLSILAPIDLGYAMVLIPSLRPGKQRLGLLFWSLTFVSSLVALMSGSLAPMVQPLLVYLLGWLLVRRRLRVWPIVLGVLAVLLFQPVKGEFRAKVWDREVRLSLVERAQLFVDLSARHWLGGETAPTVDRERSVKVAAARTASALQLAHIIEMTPAAIPHQLGKTYRYFRYTLLPRVFFPDKPSAQYADVWAAVMYGYTTPTGTAHVMVGLPQLAESYINFGFVGGLLVVLLVGFLLRIADEIFAHRHAGTGALALFLFFSQQVMRTFEGSAGQFWGGVLQQFGLYALVLFLYGALLRAAQPRLSSVPTSV